MADAAILLPQGRRDGSVPMDLPLACAMMPAMALPKVRPAHKKGSIPRQVRLVGAVMQGVLDTSSCIPLPCISLSACPRT